MVLEEYIADDQIDRTFDAQNFLILVLGTGTLVTVQISVQFVYDQLTTLTKWLQWFCWKAGLLCFFVKRGIFHPKPEELVDDCSANEHNLETFCAPCTL